MGFSQNRFDLNTPVYECVHGASDKPTRIGPDQSLRGHFHKPSHTDQFRPRPRYKIRIYSSRNVLKFVESVRNINWSDVLKCFDPQECYTKFFKKLNEVYEISFPFREYVTTYKNRKPWLTEGIKTAIKRKNELWVKCQTYSSMHFALQYNEYKKYLQRVCRKAEKDYYDNLFNENKNDIVKSWKIIRNIINSKKNSHINETFHIENKDVNDKEIIANKFNEFYVNIGPTLARNIPSGRCEPISYIKNGIVNSIFLRSVNENEVVTILKDMKSSSPGWDDISPRIVKQTYKCFLEPLVHISNISILHGVFPNELKIAKVIPLYKGGESKLLVNYRPVSVLPVFSKLLERLMYERITEFIDENEVLYNLQFGFRKNHSTTIALSLLNDKISKSLYDGEYVLGVFLDFSKAFDTVNHDILLRKLYAYGIRGVAHDWLKSYLSCRAQYVVFRGIESTKRAVTCGVPQGSILGPLLFLLYINDMASVSTILYPMLFADDTNVFLSGRNANHLIRIMNGELLNIVDWLDCNRLSLNVSKTHFILFRSQGMRNPVINEELTIKNEPIKQDYKTKFLGVIVDEKLTWSEHIQYIKCKIAKGIGIISKARRLLKNETLRILYYCFVYPYLNYCVEVWGDTFKTYLQTLVKLQRRVLRIISQSKWNESVDHLYKFYNIMQLKKIHFYKVALLMFRVKTLSAPSVFRAIFIENKDVHNYDTRQREKFHVPSVKRDYMQRTISYRG